MRRESVLFEPVLKPWRRPKRREDSIRRGLDPPNELEVARAAIDAKFYDVLMLPYHHKQQNYLEFRQTITKPLKPGWESWP